MTASGTTNAVFAFAILLPSIAVCLSIDEAIKQDADVNAFNFFQPTKNGTIFIQTELDMVMTIDQYKALRTPEKSRDKKKALVVFFNLWPWGRVLYDIHESIERFRTNIQAALDHWQMYTCLTFEEAQLTNRGLMFVASTSCSSRVGMTQGVQNVNLQEWCANRLSAIIHEIGHAIGFFHEHNRPDRDSYLTIAYPPYHSWVHDMFRRYDRYTHTYGIAYDYRSVMHYAKNSAMTTKDPAYQYIIGHAPGLSFKDIKLANLMYDCHTRVGKCANKQCPFNGFVFFKAFKGMPKCECFCESLNSSDPLVPCSSIDREVPGPNIPAASSSVEVKASICVDMRENCIALKEKGLCLTEIKMMSVECTKTCGLCDKRISLCMDDDNACALMASTGACKDEGLEETLSKLCPKSCKVCAKPSSGCEIEQALMQSVNVGVSMKVKWNSTFLVLIIAFIFALV